MPKWEEQKKTSLPASNRKTQKGGIPHILEPRCKVCTFQHRRLIDQMLVSGLSYSEIERQFTSMKGPKRRSIAAHARLHLGYEEAGLREVLEREALANQRNFEEGKTRIITKNSYMEVALQKAFDAVVNGDITVEPKDAVKIIEMQTKMQEANYAVELDELRTQLQFFLRAVKEVVPKGLWNTIVDRMAELMRAAGREVDWIEEAKEIEELTPAKVV